MSTPAVSRSEPLWPSGWEVEGGDPSVGIFGETMIHDGCEVEGSDDYEADLEDRITGRRVTTRGEEILTVETTATCRACRTSVRIRTEESNGPAADYDWPEDPS